ncbi:unnamed protein product [Parnassius mnemosyne]|uniref:Reverse transcriptase domain-containing protein n=1 Tax=Parnassius mnemosyne TaxID=213953 RepID=A0AAV1MBZ6_9NEOP
MTTLRVVLESYAKHDAFNFHKEISSFIGYKKTKYQLIDEHTVPILDIKKKKNRPSHLPKDWLTSSFITLPKKANAKKCEKFRTIILMSQAKKLFLHINIHERIRVKCDEQLADSQFGFRSGVSTREALFAIQVLVQKCLDMQQDVFLCFIDYEKAFDRVLHDSLIAILQNIGLDGKDIRIILNLYWNQRATVRVDNEETAHIEIKRGVQQGCILSPTLFNLYSETIIAETTKLMVISKNNFDDFNITVADLKLERVRKYKYLGTWLNETWSSDQEIKTRIEMARSTFSKMKKVLCNRRLKISLRTRLLRCYIWPIFLYGCEALTVKEDLRKRIEAFEMCAYRQMLGISWTRRITNVGVLRRVDQKRELRQTVKMRKVAYLGHVLRHERYGLLKLIVMGKVAGKRGVGRRKKSWLCNIREWTGIASAVELFRLAKNRAEFTKLTANLR